MKHPWIGRLFAGVLAGWLALCAPAGAHIQVRPTQAAPDDSVLFEVLVPDERQKPTTKVEVAVPKDVLPFSFEEVPGFKRTTTKNPDGSIRTIIWRGNIGAEGFGRFTFLASTPPKAGPIAWKAIQTYSDGQKVRWIGPPDSDEPAAVTRVSKSYPLQNAGGESAKAAATGSPAAPAAAEKASDSGGDNTPGLILGIAALAVALAALGVSLVSRRRPAA